MSSQNFTILACLLAFMWSQVIRAIFFSVVPVAAREWGLTAVQAGIMLSSSFLGYSAAVWLSGFLPGQRKWVIVAGGALSLIALLLMQVASGYLAIMLLATMMSFGAGLYLPRGVSLVSDASKPDTKSRNISLHEIGAITGLSVGPLFTGAALKSFDWKYALLSGAILTVFCMVMVALVKENSSGVAARKAAPMIPVNRKLFAYALSMGSAFVLAAGLVSVFPLLMVEKFGVQPSFAASYVGSTRFIGLAGPLISGFLATRYGTHRSLYAVFTLSGACLVVMALSGYNLLFTSALLLMTLCAFASTPLLYLMVAEAYPPEQKDRAYSLILGLAQLFGLVGAPTVFGYLIGGFPASATFAAAAAAVFAGLGGIWDVSRHEREITERS